MSATDPNNTPDIAAHAGCVRRLVRRLREWRYYWRLHLGWMPIQFCMVCGKPYWGGWPRWSRQWVSVDGEDHKEWNASNCRKAWVPDWMPWWSDYCSSSCSHADILPKC